MHIKLIASGLFKCKWFCFGKLFRILMYCCWSFGYVYLCEYKMEISIDVHVHFISIQVDFWNQRNRKRSENKIQPSNVIDTVQRWLLRGKYHCILYDNTMSTMWILAETMTRKSTIKYKSISLATIIITQYTTCISFSFEHTEISKARWLF